MLPFIGPLLTLPLFFGKRIRPRGALFTAGPGTYKIPAFNDVPEIFNVSLMSDVDNPFAVHSSKAIGEPPFFLGSAVSLRYSILPMRDRMFDLTRFLRYHRLYQVFFAIKDAVTAARKQNLGEDAYFEMRLPATSERIRMYCADSIAEMATSQMLGKDGVSRFFQPQGSY
jgi:xanthine dehydrogenase/oxidase